ncbi:uncharacterized protein LOC117327313 [Pecten maximus]|uniref:uncharacterized protein LOC117327313 n=1 Tax=Pecten maximus TaxID=6579 RepID=UPI001458C84C|nr:uncharacterized protein LOC117327313 [Pecten maximus]XP_033740130.1 uncharacterized protein LOC117327313 [Pecten maximus]
MDLRKARMIYNRLKTEMHNAYYTKTMVDNLENFRTEASTHLLGPGLYQYQSFLEICQNLEGKGVIGWDKLGTLKDLVQTTSGGETHLLEMINKAENDIQGLSGNIQQTRVVVPVQDTPEDTVSGPAGNFHKTNSSALPYNDIQIIGKYDLDKYVGLIQITGRLEDSGTGFRVGEKYLMTAYHVFKRTIDQVWERAIQKVKHSQRKGELYREIESLFNISEDEITPLNIKPKKQPLPFGKLFEQFRRQDNGINVEVFETLLKESISVKFGFKDGKPTAGEFHFEYDIPFADADHDVLVLQISEGENTLPPPLPLEEEFVTSSVHLFGYPQGFMKLLSDIKCSIYVDNNELQKDVTKAIEWWKGEGHSFENHYAVCRYADDKRYTDTGKMFLQTSKQFEHNSSGSPVVAIINDRPVVQLMYLRGYPEFCYSKENSLPPPPPQYLFEAGVAMPVVTQLLRECCPNIMGK